MTSLPLPSSSPLSVRRSPAPASRSPLGAGGRCRRAEENSYSPPRPKPMALNDASATPIARRPACLRPGGKAPWQMRCEGRRLEPRRGQAWHPQAQGLHPPHVPLPQGTKAQPSESFKETMKRVSYGDILKATNWFSPVNRISSSHTASVYIGRFEFETDLVAIKVFHLSEQGSRNSFFSECEVLKHTRHRNLVQAITLCSTVDFEGDEFKAIVYEFMANGSLDMWIHPRVGSSRRLLSLGQRISIAADVASALDYMHNQLTPPLIHCDLKPSNVLLDYDMTSRIGDFGSAKFLSSSSGRPEGFIGIGGTIGYIAPEYGMGCKISTGGDVYGFGVLLLEMLTAMRPTDAQCGNALSLHKYVDLAFPERIAEVIDPHMPSEEDEAAASVRMQNYIIPLVSIGLVCTMESPKDRPGMRDICAKIVAIKEAFVETL